MSDGETIGDLLQAMSVTVESPDGRIWARVHDYTHLQVGFYPWTFEQFDEPALAYQLSRLGILTWVAWSRERTELYRRSLNLSAEEAQRAERTDDPHQQRYEAELNAIEADGVSARGTLRMHTVGMLQWQVDIEPGTLRRLGEQPFLGEIHSAFEALMQDRQRKIIILKGDYFDLGIPRHWLEVMKEARAINQRNRR
jgi:hypothetical protein